jgi:hypothetical protein
MARVATETIILDITALLVPGCAILGFAIHNGRQPLLYVTGGVFILIYGVLQYFRLRKRS